METVYYNFYAFENAKASGGEDHRALLVRDCAPQRRAAGGGKVISLEDYRARQASFTAEEQPEEALWEECEENRWAEEPGVSGSVRTAAPRASRWNRLLVTLELAACGALIAVAAVACAVFL